MRAPTRVLRKPAFLSLKLHQERLNVNGRKTGHHRPRARMLSFRRLTYAGSDQGLKAYLAVHVDAVCALVWLPIVHHIGY